MDNITIRQIHITNSDYYKVYDLREEILRRPIGLSLKDEDLSGDILDIILVAEKKEEILGCVMLHPTSDAGIYKLRQMAVLDGLQGKGIGKALVNAAEQTLRDRGINKIILHARETATGFYQKLGYNITSGLFIEVGIPHIVMEKHIA
jgi:N-acetylglutamate synthase-like GNAT family acetyltransferase